MATKGQVPPKAVVNPTASTQQTTQQKKQTGMLGSGGKPQPSGKVSIVKEDGLIKKFTKHTDSN